MKYEQNDIKKIADFYDSFLASEPGKHSSLEEFHARFSPVLLYLESTKNINKILDVGCGTGLAAEKLKKYGEVYGIDISPKSIDEAGKYNRCDKCFLGIAEDLPFNDNIFDVVVCTEVMEHLLDPKKALSEFNRVLVDAGVLIISTPNPWYWRIIMYKFIKKAKRTQSSQSGQIIENFISIPNLKKLILKNGFEIAHFHTAYFRPKFLNTCINLTNCLGLYQIYICRKYK